MTDTKQLLKQLKEIKTSKNLSLDQILKLIEDNGDFVSKSTLSRVFSEGSEDVDFRYETTLRPICDALLDIENIETDDSTDVKAYKSILKLKKDIILEMKQELESEKVNYAEKLEEETAKFQKSLDFVHHQIELKDQRIDALMSLTTELMQTNNKLLKQLMVCPYHQGKDMDVDVDIENED